MVEGIKLEMVVVELAGGVRWTWEIAWMSLGVWMRMSVCLFVGFESDVQSQAQEGRW